MKITDLKNEIDNYYDIVKMTDLEHMFNIYEDQHENYKYNLNITLYVDALSYDIHVLNHDLQWPTISYQLYGTTRLAWLLMKLNNVDAAHVFDFVKAGDKVKYIPNNYVQQILNTIY